MTRDEEEIKYLLENVDPKYHDAVSRALLDLANWYGDKSYRELDQWFTIVYGMILDLEDTLQCKRKHEAVKLDVDDLTAKPK